MNEWNPTGLELESYHWSTLQGCSPWCREMRARHPRESFSFFLFCFGVGWQWPSRRRRRKRKRGRGGDREGRASALQSTIFPVMLFTHSLPSREPALFPAKGETLLEWPFDPSTTTIKTRLQSPTSTSNTSFWLVHGCLFCFGLLVNCHFQISMLLTGEPGDVCVVGNWYYLWLASLVSCFSSFASGFVTL